MPEHKETIEAAGYEASTLLTLAYGTLQQLSWTIKYAGENILLAYTPRSWNRYDNEISIETKDNELSVTSKMVHGEAFDMMKRTQKDVNDFSAAFKECMTKATEENMVEWKQKISTLETDTIKAAEEEVKSMEEVEKVMKFSTGGMQVTYGLIFINVAIFLAMVATGVHFFEPKAWDVLKWGASYPGMDLNGDWWRAFTSMFLHFGILHLALNMYALYSVGVYLEPMLGKGRYTAAYLCAGLLASIVSIIWRKNEAIVGAGASGAIFGMYGVFLALLVTNIIPKQVKQMMLSSVLVFVAFNVFYGFKPGSGIDNAAHLGGLVSGFLIGLFYALTFKNPSQAKTAGITGLVVAATAVILYVGFTNTSVPPSRVDFKTGEITYGDAATNALLQKKMEEFSKLEMTALAADEDSTLTNEQRVNYYEQTSLPAWEKAAELIGEVKKETQKEEQKSMMIALEKYIALRQELTGLQIKAIKEDTDVYNERISETVQKINAILNDPSVSQ